MRLMLRTTASRFVVAAVAAAALGLTGCTAPDAATSGETGSSAPVSAPTPLARTGTPELRASVVAGGLSHVWDLGFLPDGRVLLTQRDGRIAMLSGTKPGPRSRPSPPISP